MSKILQSIYLIMCCTLCASHLHAQWTQPDTIYIQLDDCAEMGTYCLDIPYADIGDYNIKVDSSDYFGMIEGCKVDTFFAMTYENTFGQGNLGPYYLDAWQVNDTVFTGEFLNIEALVDSMNTWDPTGNWEDIPESLFIRGGNPSYTYSDMDLTVIAIDLPSFIKVNISTQDAQGTILRFGRGVHYLEVYDPVTMTSMTSHVAVGCPQDSEQNSLITINSMETQCLDQLDFGLAGPIASLINTCPSTEGIADFTEMDYCAVATGVNLGTTSACYEVCDEFGFCASFMWDVTVESNTSGFPQTTYSLPVYSEGTHCFDLSELNGDIITISTTCDNANGNEVVFEALNETSYCVNFNTIGVGVDTICYNFVDSDGDTLVSTVIVESNPPSPEWIDIPINMGDSTQVCPDQSEVSSNDLSIINICENSVTEAATFEINDVSLCIGIEAVGLGIDTACIVLCDQNSVCDTTYYVVMVVEEGAPISPPVANDDSSQTLQNTSVVINTCNNDVIPGNTLVDHYILSIADGGTGPLNGAAVFNEDCTITYLPNAGFCNGTDQFTYVICNGFGCAEAQVQIQVNCEAEPNVVRVEDLVIYSGFSPNQDNINDFFTIEGIESAPSNNLFIYNRWGNEVFQKHNYRNNWDGTWNGKPLPDGTYFYRLDIDTGEVLSGFVQLQR